MTIRLALIYEESYIDVILHIRTMLVNKRSLLLTKAPYYQAFSHGAFHVPIKKRLYTYIN